MTVITTKTMPVKIITADTIRNERKIFPGKEVEYFNDLVFERLRAIENSNQSLKFELLIPFLVFGYATTDIQFIIDAGYTVHRYPDRQVWKVTVDFD